MLSLIYVFGVVSGGDVASAAPFAPPSFVNVDDVVAVVVDVDVAVVNGFERRLRSCAFGTVNCDNKYFEKIKSYTLIGSNRSTTPLFVKIGIRRQCILNFLLTQKPINLKNK